MSDHQLKSGNDCSDASTQCGDPEIMAPYEYLRSVGGKQVRVQLAHAFNLWLCVADPHLAAVCDVVEMLHNASLMVDDIEDDSTMRRGSPAAHCIYGVPRTINAANCAYFFALQKCLHLAGDDAQKNAKAAAIFTEEMIELHRGQGKDIYWRDTVTCPDLQQYTAMVKQKTGGLFKLAVRLLQTFSDCTDDFGALIDKLGLLFQIRDDYANLRSSDYAAMKTFAEDLTEGKLSYPIIVAIRSGRPEAKLVLEIVRQRPTVTEVKAHCVKLLEQCGALRQTVDYLDLLVEDIEKGIAAHGGNTLLSDLVNRLALLWRAQ